MGRGREIFDRLTDDAEMGLEILPGQPIVEITGNSRVLVEQHLGVKAYSGLKIVVKMKYGCVCICGSSLELIHMTRERLIIKGCIESIMLQRRG